MPVEFLPQHQTNQPNDTGMARLQQRISEPMQAQLDMINHGARLLATDRSTMHAFAYAIMRDVDEFIPRESQATPSPQSDAREIARTLQRSVERGGEDYQILLKSLGILRFRYSIDLTEAPTFTSAYPIPFTGFSDSSMGGVSDRRECAVVQRTHATIRDVAKRMLKSQPKLPSVLHRECGTAKISQELARESYVRKQLVSELAQLEPATARHHSRLEEDTEDFEDTTISPEQGQLIDEIAAHTVQMLKDAPRSKTDPHVAALAEGLSIQKDPLKFFMTLGTDREHQTAAEIVRRHAEILIDPHELQQFRGADDGRRMQSVLETLLIHHLQTRAHPQEAEEAENTLARRVADQSWSLCTELARSAAFLLPGLLANHLLLPELVEIVPFRVLQTIHVVRGLQVIGWATVVALMERSRNYAIQEERNLFVRQWRQQRPPTLPDTGQQAASVLEAIRDYPSEAAS